jgi:hypothetical protein
VSRTPTWLLEHARNVHSQRGEDGVIEKILETLPERDGWCVEFGAWDGLHLSNTRNLIVNKGYSAVLVEADPARFLQLQTNYADRPAVIAKQAFVGFTAADGLDALCGDTPLPTGFDLLSIDIDGNDYHVWKAIVRYRPKVVVIEFNQTIPTPVSFVQPADPAVSQGSSLLAFVELAKEKGYELVCVLEHNAFFVRGEHLPLFDLATNAPEVLRTNTKDVTHFFTGYDGTVFLRGGARLPWHKLHILENGLQVLPAVLRAFPESYSPFQKWLFGWYRTFLKLRDAVRSPGSLRP